MGFSVTVDDGDVRASWRLAVAEIGAGTAQAVRHAVRVGERVARAEAPRKTGALEASTVGELTSSTGMSAAGVVKADAPHAASIHDGSKPHEITGNPLAFESGGKKVFTRRVFHPGTRANPFIDRAAPATEEALTSEMTTIVNAATAKFSG